MADDGGTVAMALSIGGGLSDLGIGAGTQGELTGWHQEMLILTRSMANSLKEMGRNSTKSSWFGDGKGSLTDALLDSITKALAPLIAMGPALLAMGATLGIMAGLGRASAGIGQALVDQLAPPANAQVTPANNLVLPPPGSAAYTSLMAHQAPWNSQGGLESTPELYQNGNGTTSMMDRSYGGSDGALAQSVVAFQQTNPLVVDFGKTVMGVNDEFDVSKDVITQHMMTLQDSIGVISQQTSIMGDFGQVLQTLTSATSTAASSMSVAASTVAALASTRSSGGGGGGGGSVNFTVAGNTNTYTSSNSGIQTITTGGHTYGIGIRTVS